MISCVFAALLAAVSPATPPVGPRLVVFIAVDQLRPDYLERYRAQWAGGFKRLLEQAAYFPNGRQYHAITETSPGHSTFLSGREPARTGIITNSRGVQDPTAPLVDVRETGASPRNFRGSTLFDWMRRQDPNAQVLSVSRKDKGAILPVGRAQGQVYWYAGGRFTTSRYYADSLPAWVMAYNARKGPERLAGGRWELSRPSASYGEPDSMPWENDGRDYLFPHILPSTGDSMAARMSDYPWMDSLTLDLALHGVEALHLGQREDADLLVISLSTTDAVGHDFGPDSRELHDMLLRLDGWLGWFLDSLGALVPPDSTVFALSSDHGVQSFTEFTSQRTGRKVERLWLGSLASKMGRELRQRYLTDFGLSFDPGLISADVAALRARRINVDSLSRSLAAAAMQVRGVSRVFTPATLRDAPANDPEATLWRRHLPVDAGWLLAAVLQPGYTWQATDGWTHHATTNALDVGVPIAFWGAGIRPGVYQRAVNTVDIAPTLAALLRIRPTERLDGQVIPELLPPARRPTAATATTNVERE